MLAPSLLLSDTRRQDAAHSDVSKAVRSLVERSHCGRMIFVTEMLAMPPPAAPEDNLTSLLHRGQEAPIGREAFTSELDWVVFEALCREAGVVAPSLHEMLPNAGMSIE